MKSAAQIAYETDVKKYKEAGGKMQRCSWDELPEYAKQSWKRNPTPREWYYKTGGLTHL